MKRTSFNRIRYVRNLPPIGRQIEPQRRLNSRAYLQKATILLSSMDQILGRQLLRAGAIGVMLDSLKHPKLHSLCRAECKPTWEANTFGQGERHWIRPTLSARQSTTSLCQIDQSSALPDRSIHLHLQVARRNVRLSVSTERAYQHPFRSGRLCTGSLKNLSK